MERVHEYVAINLETLLESNILDVLEPRLIKQLGLFVTKMQNDKSPQRRLTMSVNLDNHADWLALQDIPYPFVPSNNGHPRSHTRTATKRASRLQLTPAKPVGTKSDDIFDMDDMDTALTTPDEDQHAPVSQVWRAASSPR